MSNDYIARLREADRQTIKMVSGARSEAVLVPEGAWPALVEVVAAAGKLEAEMTNPVPCHVMRAQHRKDLTAALARLRASVGEGG